MLPRSSVLPGYKYAPAWAYARACLRPFALQGAGLLQKIHIDSLFFSDLTYVVRSPAGRLSPPQELLTPSGLRPGLAASVASAPVKFARQVVTRSPNGDASSPGLPGLFSGSICLCKGASLSCVRSRTICVLYVVRTYHGSRHGGSRVVPYHT